MEIRVILLEIRALLVQISSRIIDYTLVLTFL